MKKKLPWVATSINYGDNCEIKSFLKKNSEYNQPTQNKEGYSLKIKWLFSFSRCYYQISRFNDI